MRECPLTKTENINLKSEAIASQEKEKKEYKTEEENRH